MLFATPGMISGGFSLEVFKQWAPSEMNLVTLPGYFTFIRFNFFSFWEVTFNFDVFSVSDEVDLDSYVLPQ